MKSNKTSRTCLFCGRSPTTREHVLPQWLRDLLVAPGQQPHEMGSYKTGVRHRWKSKKVDFKARVVCGPCNTGWMSDLEGVAQPYLTPMIQGNAQTLDEAAKDVCALWAVKTAMMLDRAGRDRTFLDAAYAALYGAQRPPENVALWMAASAHGRGFFGESSELKLGLPSGVADAHTMNLRFGHLVLHLLMIEAEDEPPTEVGGGFDNAMVCLWPTDGPVTWPPEVTLSVEDAEALGRLIARR